MKNTFYFAILILFLTACTIRFDRVPKNTLDEFPKEMQGKYLFTSRQHTDSTYFTITSHAIKLSEKNIMEGGPLSDSLKLAKEGSFYFFCQKGIEKHKIVWDVYPVKFSGNKLFLYALTEDRHKKAYKKYFKKVEGFDNLYEMNEAKLAKFCKRKLKQKDALKLIRVE